MRLSKLELIGIISGVVIVCAILGYVNFVVLDEEDSNNVKKVNDYAVTIDNSNRNSSQNEDSALSTEAEMYPYRAMLTYAQQTLYDQIFENAMKLNTSFKLGSTLDNSSMLTVMTAVYNDHPELFWIDTSCSYEYTTDGKVGFVMLNFNDTASAISINKSKFDTEVNDIIAQTAGLENDLDKEKFVYKCLMDRISYDESSALNQSAYSAIVNGRSVCAGYARSFQYIMLKLGIPCYLCTGEAQGNPHGWNIIKINGNYYNADMTWDDTVHEGSNKTSFQYFNIPDSVILKDHSRKDLSLNLPVCY